VLRRRDLAQGNLEVVRIVKRVHKISVERGDVIEDRKALLDPSEFLAECLLCELDLSGVEAFPKLASALAECYNGGMGSGITSYSRDLKTGSDLRWESALCSAEDDVEELLRSRDWGDVLIANCQVILLRPKGLAVRTFHVVLAGILGEF